VRITRHVTTTLFAARTTFSKARPSADTCSATDTRNSCALSTASSGTSRPAGRSTLRRRGDVRRRRKKPASSVDNGASQSCRLGASRGRPCVRRGTVVAGHTARAGHCVVEDFRARGILSPPSGGAPDRGCSATARPLSRPASKRAEINALEPIDAVLGEELTLREMRRVKAVLTCPTQNRRVVAMRAAG
jgi:hypothetical protein